MGAGGAQAHNGDGSGRGPHRAWSLDRRSGREVAGRATPSPCPRSFPSSFLDCYISITREDVVTAVKMHPGVVVALVIVGTLGWLLFLSILPDDAYGEEDTRVYTHQTIKTQNRTQIVVLGDIGRSPRMQNHALCVARYNVAVDLIGYLGMLPHTSATSSSCLMKLQRAKCTQRSRQTNL